MLTFRFHGGDFLIKIAFYVSGKATRLLRLFEKDSIVLQDTHLVVFDGDTLENLRYKCKEKDIRLFEIDYKTLSLYKKERNKYLSQKLLELFKEMRITHCFCFGSLILEGELLDMYENKIINFHPSILPQFIGTKAIDRAIESGAFLLGNTAHFVTSELDGGPIIMQSIIHSSQFKDYDCVLDLAVPMIEQIFMWLKDNKISVFNDKVEIKDATYNVAFYPHIDMGGGNVESKYIFLTYFFLYISCIRRKYGLS